MTEGAIANEASPDSALTEATKNAESILDQLARLAIAIRKSGTNSRLQKADSSFNPKDHDDLQKHLTHIVLARPSTQEDRRHVYWDSIAQDSAVDFPPDAGNLSIVQKRLISTNLRRSNRFMYAQRHAKKLGGQPVVSIRIPTLDQEAVTSTTEETKPTDDEGRTQRTVKSTNVGQKPITYAKSLNIVPDAAEVTDTTASAVGTAIVVEQVKISTPSQQAMTEVSTTGSKLHYPRPPNIRDGLQSFKCPCCCQTLSKMFTERQRWRSVLEHPSAVSMWLIQWSKQETYLRRHLSVYMRPQRLSKTGCSVYHTRGMDEPYEQRP
jgi:hypothetical protein